MIFIRIFGEKKIESEGGLFLAYLYQRLLETDGKQIRKTALHADVLFSYIIEELRTIDFGCKISEKNLKHLIQVV